MRIEVGRGLEGALTDLASNRIIDETIRPAFRAGEFGAGIEAGVDRVIGVIDGEELPPPDPRWSDGKRESGGFSGGRVALVVALALIGGILLLISASLGRLPQSLSMGGTFGIAARDVQVQLDLPPGFEIVRYSGEEFSADPTEIEPQHLSPDDGMVFLQSVRTCAPELLGPDSLITVHLRWLDAQTFAPQSMSLPVRFSDALAADRTPML